eukprot:SAG31_NODE_1430_length_8385_cov_3.096186_3_plen_162_part_00
MSADSFVDLLARFHDFTLYAASLHPKVVCEGVEAIPLVMGKSGQDTREDSEQERGAIDQTDAVWRVRIRLANRGVLSTNLTSRGQQLSQRCPPVTAEFKPAYGVKVINNYAKQMVGHLAGETGIARCEWFVIGKYSSSNCLGMICIYGGMGGDLEVHVDAN